MHTSGENGAPGCPASVLELVARFDLHSETYKQQTYNETQVRREFIDPMFAALGWDIDNEGGHAEAYKDVIHEDAIKIGGATKAPDYCFRIGGVRKFFVEAKKPAEDIKQKREHAYQLRRYAWTAKLPVSVLTDFEEFAVFDCTKRPKPTDKASTGRILYVTFDEYAQRWGDISSVFSKDAILKGAFDKYAESAKRKRGTAEVDTEFLKEIEQWRDLLARNIALRNPSLTVRELNYAVSKTIDRIIFLRMCEDRGVETYAQLRILPNGPDIYPRLVELFRRADERYNSGLFHFEHEKGRTEEPDTLTPGLTIDDKVLKDIINRLYYPECPYEFSVMPSEILGQVYEQFLGKVIRLTKGHRAVVEEKPEVKKAGGVYYTPKYIVDYIVEHTVGKLLEDKTPADLCGTGFQPVKRKRDRKGAANAKRKRPVPTLRILDPACGSGSFLLGAYQYLLDWHLRWYGDNDPQAWATKKNPPLYQSTILHPQSSIATWRLTVAERKRILLNNIYGVDIDPQAVEVTKLSLLLKVLEGESQQTLDNQLRLFHERALPDLAANIKCGNSLIGPDFYDNQQMTLLDEEERYRINVFDWEAEFPDIFKPSRDREGADKTGGFDAVIGNPPYVRIQNMKEYAPLEVEHYKNRYKSASKGNYDIYVVFVERGLSLLNENGTLGFIAPHKFFNAKYGQPLRKIIADGKHLSHVVHFGDQQVFKGATTYTCLLFLCCQQSARFDVSLVSVLRGWQSHGSAKTGELPCTDVTAAVWSFQIGQGADLFRKLSAFPYKLGDVARVFVGLQTSADTVFLFKNLKFATTPTTRVFSKELGKEFELETALLKPVVRSGSIGRYWAAASAAVLFPYHRKDKRYVLFSESELASYAPKCLQYLRQNQHILSSRERGKFRGEGWFQLYPKNLDDWEQPKLMLPYMVTRLAAHLDRTSSYFVNVTTGGFGLTSTNESVGLEYLTGLLNSKLLHWFFKCVSSTFHGGYFGANKQYLVQIPIRVIDSANDRDKSRHDRMVELVDRMLGLHKQLGAAKTPTDKTGIQRQIDATDRQIDKLAYELYGLTKEEIKIVEEASNA